MNAVFSWSAGFIAIWWYPWNTSRKLILWWLDVALTSWLILGSRNGSLGQVLFRSVKSIQTLHFPFFFLTTTVLESHVGYRISLIAPTSINRFTSSHIASLWSGESRCPFWTTGRDSRSTLRLWQAKAGSTPGASYGLQANTSIYSNSSVIKPSLCSGGRDAPNKKYFSWFEADSWCFTSSSAYFSCGRRSSLSSQSYDCYLFTFDSGSGP